MKAWSAGTAYPTGMARTEPGTATPASCGMTTTVPWCAAAAIVSSCPHTAYDGGPAQQGAVDNGRVVESVADWRQGEHHIAPSDPGTLIGSVDELDQLPVTDRGRPQSAVLTAGERQQRDVIRPAPGRPDHVEPEQITESGGARRVYEREHLAHPRSIDSGQRGVGKRRRCDDHPGAALGELASGLDRAQAHVNR